MAQKPDEMPWCGTCGLYPSCEPRRKAGVDAFLIFSCLMHTSLPEVKRIPVGRQLLVWTFDTRLLGDRA